MYTWEDFLNEYCGCSCDEMGNRPCDNGACCDRCTTVWKLKGADVND